MINQHININYFTFIQFVAETSPSSPNIIFLKSLKTIVPQVHPAQRGRDGTVPRHHPQLLQGRARRLHLVLRLRADAGETGSADDLSGKDELMSSLEYSSPPCGHLLSDLAPEYGERPHMLVGRVMHPV